MRVLIIGRGGREHALAWKMAQSTRVDQVYVAPGNAGTAQEPKVVNVPIAAHQLTKLVDFARQQAIALTVVGPEAPLVAGVVDRFQDAGLRCLGPTQAAAQLEGSKAFAKAFLQRHHIPTAACETFQTFEAAVDHLARCQLPVVIKADGLAAGKGVIIAHTHEEARNALHAMLVARVFGNAGHTVLIEDYLVGDEVSFMVLVDGEQVIPLATSQDHKARDDGDRGPNTGGMGAYSPTPIVTPSLHQQILDTVIYPTVRGMAAEGHPYRGFLYAGLMIVSGAPLVLEYNCRLGDPEAQPILMRLRSDLVDLCEAALTSTLHDVSVDWSPQAALGVVMAAAGYPGDVAEGIPITLPAADTLPVSVKIFHAGTALKDNQVVTQGGRVLCVTALGNDLRQAHERAYRTVNQVHWDGAFYRRDIGYRALAVPFNRNPLK